MEEVINAPETAGTRSNRVDKSSRPGVNTLLRRGGAGRSRSEFRCKLLVWRRIICMERCDSAAMLIAIRNRFHQELHTAPALTERFAIRRVCLLLPSRFRSGSAAGHIVSGKVRSCLALFYILNPFAFIACF